MNRLTLLCALFVASLVYGQSNENLIQNLPGAPSNLNFSMYSGYIPVNGNYYFYWFVEAESNPQTAPLMLWLNGGPGCSSLGGLLSENGPFSPTASGELKPNPYAWNRIANVLYLESPAGVGFSYCGGGSCPRFNDEKTAEDNYKFLQLWFQQYSQFSSNDFYIAGESYAGHYIPELVQKIYLATSSNPSVPPQSNFKGFAAGNPLSDQGYDLEGPYLNTYYQTHGLLQLGDTNGSPDGSLDPYDILGDVCNARRLSNYIRFPHPFNQMKGVEGNQKRYVPNQPACIDDFVQDYLNNAAVMKAIHANPSISWTQCGGPAYTFSTQSMIPIYQTFLNSTSYNILVYSGDADTVLNFIATEQWILDLHLPISSRWTSWSYSDNAGPQVGGWTVTFQGSSTPLTFTTIKGAGHMVPWFQPAPAFQMLQNWLNAK